MTFDARGNGLSDAPADPRAYADAETIADAVAILDHLGVDAVVAVGLSRGARYALELAAEHPERVRSVVALGPAVPHLTDEPAWRDSRLGQGHPRVLAAGLPGLPRVLLHARRCRSRTRRRQLEDGVAWGLDTTPEILAMTRGEQGVADRRGRRGALPRGALPRRRGPGHGGRDGAARARRARGRAHGRPARRPRGLGAPAARARPRAGEPPPARRRVAGLRMPARVGASAASQPRAGARRLVADRARTRVARRADRRRAAPSRAGPA